MALQIIVTPEEQAVAINKYLAAEYGLNLTISSDSLTAVNITVKPVFEGDVTTEKEEVEDDREWAETRAEELGISFRSDIKTSTLISRIEDEEARIAKEASQPEQVEEEEVTTDTPEDAEDLFSTPEVESTSKDSTEDGDDTNSLFG